MYKPHKSYDEILLNWARPVCVSMSCFNLSHYIPDTLHQHQRRTFVGSYTATAAAATATTITNIIIIRCECERMKEKEGKRERKNWNCSMLNKLNSEARIHSLSYVLFLSKKHDMFIVMMCLYILFLSLSLSLTPAYIFGEKRHLHAYSLTCIKYFWKICLVCTKLCRWAWLDSVQLGSAQFSL